MKDYNKCIVKQFLDAIGSKVNEQKTTIELLRELKDWLNYRKEIGKEYIMFLEELGLDYFKKSSTAEVGKGELDTLVKPFDTTLLTPYTFKLKNESRFLIGDLSVKGGIPLLKKETYEGLTQNEILRQNFTFMTQNPYTPEKIQYWHQLHNNGYNIIAGIYGNIYDKDFEEKIKLLNYLKRNLSDEYIIENLVNKDYYAFIIASSRKKIKKEKIVTLEKDYEYNNEIILTR